MATVIVLRVQGNAARGATIATAVPRHPDRPAIPRPCHPDGRPRHVVPQPCHALTHALPCHAMPYAGMGTRCPCPCPCPCLCHVMRCYACTVPVPCHEMPMPPWTCRAVPCPCLCLYLCLLLRPCQCLCRCLSPRPASCAMPMPRCDTLWRACSMPVVDHRIRSQAPSRLAESSPCATEEAALGREPLAP